jgi:heme exporter protein CcmD
MGGYAVYVWGSVGVTALLLAIEVLQARWAHRAVLAQIKAGRLRALAYNNAARAPFLPEVPTTAEAGVPGTVIDTSWNGLFVPAQTPAAIVAKLEAEIRRAFALSEVRERFEKVGRRVGKVLARKPGPANLPPRRAGERRRRKLASVRCRSRSGAAGLRACRFRDYRRLWPHRRPAH